ncbi:MAG: GDP-mannose 4,6-dehydratase, partial [Candidatus Liptonbacteria bacterium]|nr:GDP-mannose 4,6-dehydratase [Candidatus Liptonbacteria bacterium]
FDIPEYTANITGLGTLRMLEAVKDYEEHTGKKIKFYQASSSEMFGASAPPQNEETPFYPRSPYGVAKVFAYNTVRNYREAYGIFAVNGILFNHESERRGETFVTRKITRGIARILAGLDKKIYLGNLEARRDWGYAPEYCEAMYLMLQQPEPNDYVIGTGTSHSVQDFVETAFKQVGISNWKDYVAIDPRYYRPSEVHHLVADVAKAKEKLGWQPKTKFEDIVKIMMKHDLEAHGLKKPADKILL